MEEVQTDMSVQLVIDEDGKRHLAFSARWGKFLSVVGFVVCGVLIIGGLAMLFTTGNPRTLTPYSTISPTARAIGRGFMGFAYLVAGVLHFFPSLYLSQFSRKIATALLHDDQPSLTEGLEKLKKMFNFYGVLVIVVIGFYVLCALGIIIIAVLR